MKRNLPLFLIFLILASPAFGKVKESEMMQGAKLNESNSSENIIIIGVNEIAGSIVEPGWPMIVTAAMLSADELAANFPTNLKLKTTDENDKEVSITFEAIPQTNGKGNQLFWIASESTTQELSAGRYNITFEPVEGFIIESGDFVVMETNLENSWALGLLKIQRSLLLGKDDEALAQADAITASDANNTDAWIAKGDILMGKDLPDEAIKAYKKALDLVKETDSEPLFLLERHRAAFFRSLEKRGVLQKPDEKQP